MGSAPQEMIWTRNRKENTTHRNAFGPTAAIFSHSVVLIALFLAVTVFTEFFACEDLTQNLITCQQLTEFSIFTGIF